MTRYNFANPLVDYKGPDAGSWKGRVITYDRKVLGTMFEKCCD
jgi:hypothetical protein